MRTSAALNPSSTPRDEMAPTLDAISSRYKLVCAAACRSRNASPNVYTDRIEANTAVDQCVLSANGERPANGNCAAAPVCRPMWTRSNLITSGLPAILTRSGIRGTSAFLLLQFPRPTLAATPISNATRCRVRDYREYRRRYLFQRDSPGCGTTGNCSLGHTEHDATSLVLRYGVCTC